MVAHSPRYIHCSDPETCCDHWWPVVIVCAIDGQRWPCETKRSHHTPAHAARVQRWAEGRRGRPAKRQETPPMTDTRSYRYDTTYLADQLRDYIDQTLQDGVDYMQDHVDIEQHPELADRLQGYVDAVEDMQKILRDPAHQFHRGLARYIHAARQTS